MRQRVLIIDDSTQIHRLVEAWLKTDAVEVAGAATGAAGRALAASWQPDLILLDADLPDGSGFDLCRRLKSDEACCHAAVVFLTGAASAEDRVAGLNLGAVDCIVKPFHPAEFQARIHAALRTKRLFDLLQQRAQTDGLTGLRNRSYFDERLAAERASLRRHPRPLACAVFDVDRLVAVNERYGHATGDDVLRGVADVLVRTTRTEDLTARLGCDTFGVLTPGVDVGGAAVLAERVRTAVEQLSIRRGVSELRATCSAGVAGFDIHAADTLVPNAEQALAAAKSLGGNRIERHGPTTLRDWPAAA